MRIVLEYTDQWGRTIRLTEDVWVNHITAVRPNLENHLDAVRVTITEPDTVYHDARRPDAESFYRSGSHPDYPHLYLKVPVRFIADEGGTGYVMTAYLTRRIKRTETLRWNR